ncbi:MAG: dTDP-4-dehydrorhamnose 3,5-epimerase family protein [bacterium]
MIELIEGVKIVPLRLLSDERGFLMEILRSDSEHYSKFGQVYITMAYPGVVKAWHYHKEQTDYFAVVVGMAKVALYDMRDGSKTKGIVNEFFFGERNPNLIIIPPMVAHGFKAIGTRPAYVVNVPDRLYIYDKPDEFRIDPYDNDIPYYWRLKEG